MLNPALAAIAAVTIAGGVLAVSAREPRATILGLLIVMLASPLIVEPWPGPLPILARVAAAFLAARLLVIGVRTDGSSGIEVVSSGSAIGWPAEALAAAAAAVLGFASHGLGAAGLGPAEAQAASFALAGLAAAPLIAGRDVLRLGVGSLLLLDAALLLRLGLDQPPTAAEQLVASLLTIGIGGAVAVVATAARAAGGLVVPDETRRRSRPPDAHRPAGRTQERAAGRAPERAPSRTDSPRS